MINCYDDALWTQGTYLMIDGLTVSDNVTLAGVEGSLTNFVGESLAVNNLGWIYDVGFDAFITYW